MRVSNLAKCVGHLLLKTSMYILSLVVMSRQAATAAQTSWLWSTMGCIWEMDDGWDLMEALKERLGNKRLD